MSEVYGPGISQDITVTAASAATALPISLDCRMVRLVSTTNAYVIFGATPTATTGSGKSFRITANYPEVFRIAPGQKVAAIRDTADGVLTVTEMN